MKFDSIVKSYIQTLDYQAMSLLEITDAIKTNGHQLLLYQVGELLKEIRKENNEEIVDHTKDCGINRDANPCGDASDY
jgi:hypothetical protein